MKQHIANSPLIKLRLLLFSACLLAVAERSSATDYTLGTEHPITAPFPATRFLWKPDTGTFWAGSVGSGDVIGDYSAAFGSGTASGAFSFAAGFAWAGPAAAAFGSYTEASQFGGFAAGNGSWAMAACSTAFGSLTVAAGDGSAAFGVESWAGGYASTAMGVSTQAGAYASLAIGRWNVGGYGDNGTSGTTADDGDKNWLVNDAVFEIGNGTANTRKNAFVVKKNGDVGVQGVLRVWNAGDLSMGAFTSGPQPPAR